MLFEWPVRKKRAFFPSLSRLKILQSPNPLAYHQHPPPHPPHNFRPPDPRRLHIPFEKVGHRTPPSLSLSLWHALGQHVYITFVPSYWSPVALVVLRMRGGGVSYSACLPAAHRPAMSSRPRFSQLTLLAPEARRPPPPPPHICLGHHWCMLRVSSLLFFLFCDGWL